MLCAQVRECDDITVMNTVGYQRLLHYTYNMNAEKNLGRRVHA